MYLPLPSMQQRAFTRGSPARAAPTASKQVKQRCMSAKYAMRQCAVTVSIAHTSKNSLRYGNAKAVNRRRAVFVASKPAARGVIATMILAGGVLIAPVLRLALTATGCAVKRNVSPSVHPAEMHSAAAANITIATAAVNSRTVFIASAHSAARKSVPK